MFPSHALLLAHTQHMPYWTVQTFKRKMLCALIILGLLESYSLRDSIRSAAVAISETYQLTNESGRDSRVTLVHGRYI